jgi:Na+/melibiose symporter-like transporter
VNRALKLDHTARRPKVDVAGSTLIVGGVSLLLIGVQIAGSAARLTTTAVAYIIPGVALLVGFVWWEDRATEPIIPLQLFRNQVFSLVNILSFINGSVMFGALLFLPLYYQSVRNISPTQSGLRLLPMLVGVLSVSITVGRAVSRRGRYKVFVIIGTGVMTCGVAWMSTITIMTSGWALGGMLFVIGMGLGFFSQILVMAIQNAVETQYIGVASASVTFFRTLGGAIGAAVLGAVLVLEEKNSLPRFRSTYGPGVLATHHAFVYGLHQAFLLSVPLALLAFLLSFRLRELTLRTSSA